MTINACLFIYCVFAVSHQDYYHAKRIKYRRTVSHFIHRMPRVEHYVESAVLNAQLRVLSQFKMTWLAMEKCHVGPRFPPLWGRSWWTPSREKNSDNDGDAVTRSAALPELWSGRARDVTDVANPASGSSANTAPSTRTPQFTIDPFRNCRRQACSVIPRLATVLSTAENVTTRQETQ